MVEARRFVEQRKLHGQIHLEAPLVRAATGRYDSRFDRPPPWRGSCGDRLDHERVRSARGALYEPIDQPVPDLFREFVQEIRRHDSAACRGHRETCGVSLPRTSGEAKLAVRPRGLANRPRMAIDAGHRRSTSCHSPRCPCGSGAATDVEDRLRRRRVSPEGTHDERGGQVVKRGIEQRERRALATAVESVAHACSAPCHVRRGQRPKRPCYLGDPQISEVSCLERGEPRVE